MRQRIFIATTAIYILLVVSSLFNYYFPIPPAIYAPLIFVICFLLYPQSFKNYSFYAFIAYAAILFLFVITGHGIHTIGYGGSNFRRMLIEIGFVLPSISIAGVLFYLNKPTLIKNLTLFSLFAIFISILFMLPWIIADKNIVHNAAVSINYGREDANELMRKGLPGYSLIHANLIIVPAILGSLFLIKGRVKLLLGIVLAGLLFVSYRSSSTTVILLIALSSLTILTYKPRSRLRNIFVFSLVFILSILTFTSDAIPNFLDSLAAIFENTAAESKMIDFKYLYLLGERGGNLEGRMDYHLVAFNRFLDSPLIGKEGGGGHSTILDHLGGVGLIGFFPFALIPILHYLKINKNLTGSAKYYFQVSYMSALILLYSKGLFGQEGWFFLFVLMPGILLFTTETTRRQ